MTQEKPIIFRSLVLSIKDKETVELSSEGVRNLMHNLSRIVDIKDAVSSNPADTFNALMPSCNEDDLNRSARAALSAAALAAGEDVSILDAFVLGESELLTKVNEDEVEKLIINAVAFGYTEAVKELLKRNPSNDALARAVYIASDCGRKGAIQSLMHACSPTNFKTEVTNAKICDAKQNIHLYFLGKNDTIAYLK